MGSWLVVLPQAFLWPQGDQNAQKQPDSDGALHRLELDGHNNWPEVEPQAQRSCPSQPLPQTRGQGGTGCSLATPREHQDQHWQAVTSSACGLTNPDGLGSFPALKVSVGALG